MASGKSKSRATASRDQILTGCICILLAGAVFLIFTQTFHYGFVDFDDGDYFYSNPQVKAGLTWHGLVWAFQPGHADNWHPLTWLSLMLDAQLFGPGATGPHFTNTLLHAVNAVLLFLTLKRLTGIRASENERTALLWSSAFVAALFAVHPLRVESVAWISERKDVLSGLFFLLTLLIYARYAEREAAGRGHRMAYVLTMLFFALGLMCKPMLVTLPFVLLLLDWWPLNRVNRRTIWKLVGEKVPFMVLSAASCMLTLVAQKQAEIPIAWLPLWQRLENAASAYGTYLWLMIYPVKLSIIYPYTSTATAEWLIALLLLVGITIAVVVSRKRRPYLLVGWLWYLGMLVPVIGIVQVGYQAIADRYTYLPGIGVGLAAAWLVKDLSVAWPARRIWLGGAAGAILITLTDASMRQVTYWRSNLTLWQHAVASTGFNPIALVNLDVALGDLLPPEKRIQDFQRVLAEMPDYAEAHYDLGTTLYVLKRYDEAVVELQKAIDLRPGYADALNNLGNVRLEQGREDEAAALYQKTIDHDPDYLNAHLNLARLRTKEGRLEEAAEQYRAAIRLSPASAQPLVSLANILLMQGKPDEAVAQYQQALAFKSDDVEAHYNLATALGRLGRLAEAEEHFRKAAELNPGYADAHGNLANLLAKEGKWKEALPEYQRTIELLPDSGQAHFRYGEALVAGKNFTRAADEFEQTIKLEPQHVMAMVYLAWLRATCPDATLRNGTEAIQLARTAQQLTGGTSAQVQDTLAAAEAETGRFDEAVKTATAALALSTNNPTLTEAISIRIKLYQGGQAYREPQ